MTQTEIKNNLYIVIDMLSSMNISTINAGLRRLQKLEENNEVCYHTPYYLIDRIDELLSRCLYMLDISDIIRLKKNILILKRKLKEQIDII